MIRIISKKQKTSGGRHAYFETEHGIVRKPIETAVAGPAPVQGVHGSAAVFVSPRVSIPKQTWWMCVWAKIKSLL